MWIFISAILHGLALIGLTILGVHRSLLLKQFVQHQSRLSKVDTKKVTGDILIQLPVYNEATVIESTLTAISKLSWPHGQLQLHILDDSDDDTTNIISNWISEMDTALQIKHIRRNERMGFKAGALAVSMSTTTEPFICIFDADFEPKPDFLINTMPLFIEDNVGMVQTRWSHLNRHQNWLTQTAAVVLDGHFVIEHSGRFLKGCFFNFNGTAGIWRRECIVDAGGWQWDTITEDLDLSYRAQLQGWSFVYTPYIHAPAEIPSSLSAIRSQQFRWARGTTQTATKLLPSIWTANISFPIKAEATVHMLANLGYWLTLVLSLVIPFTAYLRWNPMGYWSILDGFVFVSSFLSLLVFHSISQRFLKNLNEGYSNWFAVFLALVLGVGLSVWQSWAIFRGFTSKKAIFDRTPKTGLNQNALYGTPQTNQTWWLNRVTVIFGIYSLFGIALSVYQQNFLSLPFQIIFAAGFLWVGLGSILEET